MTVEDVPLVAEFADILQIGARNSQNFNLLDACGRQPKPVLLKRGLSGTIEELLLSAEYILSRGNPNVILCERGIRTYEKATRNTLDISAVPVLKSLSHLPVVIDPSHATGPAPPGRPPLQGGGRGRRRRGPHRGPPPPGEGALRRPPEPDAPRCSTP
jgi:3-deoxy-7-phosphoheptulonate synthase